MLPRRTSLVSPKPSSRGGFIAYATVVILGIMSFGSFYILFTKWFEQSKIMRQGRELRANFWRAGTLKEGASKLEKNSAWRQLVDDGLAADETHGKMTDAMEAHDWLHGSLARSENSINARLASGLPFLANRRCHGAVHWVCSVPSSASIAR